MSRPRKCKAGDPMGKLKIVDNGTRSRDGRRVRYRCRCECGAVFRLPIDSVHDYAKTGCRLCRWEVRPSVARDIARAVARGQKVARVAELFQVSVSFVHATISRRRRIEARNAILRGQT